MNTYYTAEGNVVLDVDDAELVMTRQEAEGLFVMLGHTLQDMDVEMYNDESGESDEQPESVYDSLPCDVEP